jgi:hypothetical protein
MVDDDLRRLDLGEGKALIADRDTQLRLAIGDGVGVDRGAGLDAESSRARRSSWAALAGSPSLAASVESCLKRSRNSGVATSSMPSTRYS